MDSSPSSPSSNIALLTNPPTPAASTAITAQRFILLFTLMGMGLRIVLLGRFPFREDEAVYSTWALHFLREDPLFLTVWPDKPPLFIWLLSGAFTLWGATDWSARWLNIVISTLTIPMVAATARRLWGRPAAVVAAITVALNPYAISFASTAYTDPLLLLTGAVSFYSAVARRPFWAGFWLAAAIMTKQQGLLYIPLILGAFWLTTQEEAPISTRQHWRLLAKLLLGMALVILPILYWDSLRWAVAPSPWDLSLRNYGTLTLLPPPTWLPRLHAWSEWLSYLASGGWPVAIGAIVAIFSFSSPHPLRPTTCHLPPAILLLAWSCGFIGLHIISSVEIWDRYLLPLMLPLALVAGWVGQEVTLRHSPASLLRMLTPRWGKLVVNRHWAWPHGLLALWIGLLLPSAFQAANGKIPVGGDHGALAGLHEALAWLAAENVDTPFILYHQRLGPQYRFYLYDEIATGRVDLRWYPHIVYLMDNATKAPHRRKFLLLPDWAPLRNLPIQAAARQVEIRERMQAGRFHLLELVPRYPEDCAWCLCQLPTDRLSKWPPNWTRLE